MVELDSDSVVKIMQNKEDVAHSLSPLITNCKSLHNQLGVTTVTHFLQEGNKCVDALVNMGQDGE